MIIGVRRSAAGALGAILLLAGITRAGDAQPLKASICDLLRVPSDYSGKILTVRARVTATKEGAFLSDAGCPGLGIDLWIDAAMRSQVGLTELHQALRAHAVDATLTGVFVHDQYDQIRRRRRSVFKATSATAITDPKATARR